MKVKARRMFPVGLGLGLVLAGVGAAGLWIRTHSDAVRASPALAVNESEDPAKRATPEDLTAFKAELERLKAGKERLERFSMEMKGELTALRSRLTRVDQDQDLIGREINQLAAAGRAPAGGEEAGAAKLTPEEEHARAEAQVRVQVELFEGTLLREKTDPEWARTAGLALSEVFHSEAMTGLHLVEVECRTSLCRLRVSLDGSATPEDGFQELVHLAPWQGQGFAQIDAESGENVVYLAREGYDLPQLME